MRIELALLALSAPCFAQGVASPAEHLGRPVGTDFELADWAEVSSYYRKLAEQSPRVDVVKLGTSTEGRDFLRATITSEANLARIDEIRASAARIADPRGLTEEERATLIAETPGVLMVSLSMHSTETAGTEFGMEFSHLLATSEEEPWRSAREELVVVVLPTLNPDGLDHVVHWYREHVGTPYEGADLLELYQYYTGHDNNRDWFGLSQVETRLVTNEIYGVWHPQVYWDVHEQGSTSERFFVPPYRDPLNPNLDPGIIAGIDALGSRALWDMTREGLTGISTGVTYDMWWNGGNRNVPVRHNVIGILTEAASVNIATPMFLPIGRLRPPGDLPSYAASNRFPDPWPGGWWRLSDTIRYELAFGRSLLGSLTRERELWLANAIEAAERALEAGAGEGVRTWLIPSDNRDIGATRRLAEILLLGGVELFTAKESFRADGRDWPAGTIVIPRDQPYGTHVKDLFEVQRYPDGAAPYDVAGWTLPILFGVRRVELMASVEAELERVETADSAVAAFTAGADSGDLLTGADSDDWSRIFAALEGGNELHFHLRGDTPGAWGAAPEGAAIAEQDTPASVRVDAMPRVGLYSPWRGSMDQGWLRWVLDTYELPYVEVRNEMLRAGELGDFLDVLVVASMSASLLDRGRTPGTLPERYARGLDPEGAVAIEEFVRGGGRVVTMGSSATWAVDLFDLPLVDVTGDDGFSCPGSVLRGIPEPANLTAGMGTSQPLFFSRSSAWEVDADEDEEGNDVDVLLRYAPTRLLLSGWIQNAEVIEGKIAWARAEHGAGEVHLFGFRPQYRSWSVAAFPLLFRAILLGDA